MANSPKFSVEIISYNALTIINCLYIDDFRMQDFEFVLLVVYKYNLWKWIAYDAISSDKIAKFGVVCLLAEH